MQSNKQLVEGKVEGVGGAEVEGQVEVEISSLAAHILICNIAADNTLWEMMLVYLVLEDACAGIFKLICSGVQSMKNGISKEV